MPTAFLVTSVWLFSLCIPWLHQQSHHNPLESLCFCSSASVFFVWTANNLGTYYSEEADQTESLHTSHPLNLGNWTTGAQPPLALHSWSLPLWYVLSLAPSWCHGSSSWPTTSASCPSNLAGPVSLSPLTPLRFYLVDISSWFLNLCLWSRPLLKSVHPDTYLLSLPLARKSN